MSNSGRGERYKMRATWQTQDPLGAADALLRGKHRERKEWRSEGMAAKALCSSYRQGEYWRALLWKDHFRDQGLHSSSYKDWRILSGTDDFNDSTTQNSPTGCGMIPCVVLAPLIPPILGCWLRWLTSQAQVPHIPWPLPAPFCVATVLRQCPC